MKKLSIFLLGLLILSSFSVFAKKVELSDARLAGKNFFFDRVNISHAVSYNSINITSEVTEKNGNEPVYYIFSMNELGFVIVSAEDACQPVLGYSFNSNFSNSMQPQNLINWMNHYKEEITLVRENNFPADDNIKSSWAYLTQANFDQLRKPEATTAVEPLLKSTWNQDFPYNALCPTDPASTGSYSGRVPVGCTATSLSQIMLYWRWPITGNGYHCDIHTYHGQQCCADFGNTTYDWDGMSLGTSNECYPAAVLSYHTGISVNMQYGVDGSGAAISDVPHALSTYFKYSTAQYVTKASYNNTSWAAMLKGELDAGQPVQYAGFEPSNSGHAWVCDGYQGSGTYTEYFHFNWGWGGQSDGYYYLSNLNPSPYTFNINQQVVKSIRPNPAYYPAYCSGSKEVVTYNYGAIEDGSGPIANYQPNSSCSWLIGADDSIQSVTLTFLRFATQAGDEVKIYNGSDATAPLLGTYSGSTIPPAVSTTSNQMFITFTSGSSGSAQGFLASYNSATVPFCGGTSVLTEPSGNFTDGSDRFEYRNSTSCKWKILPANATSVTVTFNAFNSEAENDNLQIVDLGPPTVTLATLSGDYSSQLPDPVTASSGKMMLMWNTNKSIRGNGWDLSYTITVGTPENEALKEFKIFPNPATDKLNISFNSEQSQQIKLELLSVKGETLFSEILSNYKGEYMKKLDVAAYTSGIYLLRLTTDQGTNIHKIIIQ